jgi:hypothetical protein
MTASAVKRTPLNRHKPAAGVQTLQGVVTSGTASSAVQGSALAKQALADVQTALAPFAAAVTAKTNAEIALDAARKVLTVQFNVAAVAIRSYEVAVSALAGGDPAVITGAGLLTRDAKTPAAALGAVKDLRSTLGKAAKEAFLRWPLVPGATSYAIQVNWTPSAATAVWTALPNGTSRRRLVVAPTQGAQFMAQVAAIRSDGTQSAWCDAILVTAR